MVSVWDSKQKTQRLSQRSQGSPPTRLLGGGGFGTFMYKYTLPMPRTRVMAAPRESLCDAQVLAQVAVFAQLGHILLAWQHGHSPTNSVVLCLASPQCMLAAQALLS